jgi:hypothetical protein
MAAACQRHSGHSVLRSAACDTVVQWDVQQCVFTVECYVETICCANTA